MDATNSQNLKPLSFYGLRNFTDPHLHKTSKWYIDFCAMDPASGRMKRKKYYVKMHHSIRMRNKIASEMLAFLTSLLYSGWSPWAANDYSAAMTAFADCMDMYLRHVSQFSKKNTRDSYSSRVKVLREFITTQDKPIIMAYQFDTAFCCSFLDYIFIEKQDSARTRNNYRDWLFTFAEFLRQRDIIKHNPVTPIGHLKEDVKHRKDMTSSMLSRLSSYLKKRDKYFYLACMMEYYSFIRPNELSYLKIDDIRVKAQTIHLSADYSKNGIENDVALNENVTKLMLELGVLTKPNHYFLFSTDCMPGEVHVDPDMFNKKWKEIRKSLGWSDHFQFYSLKDSGIRDLANAEGVTVARDQARHADIATTNMYVQQHKVHECAKHFKGAMD